MNPGEACVACHSQGDGPGWWLGGTVFAWGKVPDRCEPPTTVDLTQVQVIITDVNGTDHTLHVNSVGNFFPNFQSGFIPQGAYHAKVVYNGKTRAMSASQTNGDCNSCHTATGANGAPGRVAIPE
jgi:hypothetical protein